MFKHKKSTNGRIPNVNDTFDFMQITASIIDHLFAVRVFYNLMLAAFKLFILQIFRNHAIANSELFANEHK